MKKIFIIFLNLALVSCTNISKEEIVQNEIKDIQQVLTNDNVEKNDLKVYIDYPVFSNSGANITIKSRFDNFVKHRQKDLQEIQSGENFYSFEKELHASFQEFSSNRTKSIYYEIFENIGGVHPINFIKIFNFDKEGNSISQDQVFKLNNETKIKLKNLIFQKLEDKKIDYFKDSFNGQDGLGDFFSKINFYVDQDKIYFVFEQYQIAPYSSGIIKLDFSINELKNFLDINFLPVNTEFETVPKENVNLEEKNTTNEKEVKVNFNPEKKYIALTFDDGPSKKYTPKLLDILKENGVKATFFVLGKNADYLSDIVKRQFDEGHEIGNHSRDHPKLTRLKDEDLKKQLFNTREKIFEITGIYTNLMRPPYGIYDEKIKNIWGETIVLWNVDSNDWRYRNVNKNVNQVLKTTNPGSIILMHDIHKESVDSVDKIIKTLKQNGYEFVTVGELLSIYQDSKNLKNKTCNSGFSCK